MADLDLRLQDPGAMSGHLLETALALASHAERGGGIFAFATADGIRALLDDDAFSALLQDGAFDLVVGVDAVTNERAIVALTTASTEHTGLTARVLVHEESVLFHPKLCWFRRGSKLTVVVGSGNLTIRGLRENWEAFTVIEVTNSAADAAEAQLSKWLRVHAHLLYEPSDPLVLEQVKLNTGRERELKHPRRKTGKDTPRTDAEVLVAEAPKSGSRPSQVNFHKVHYEGFFGAKAGSPRRVVLRAVSAAGAVGDEEVRPSSSRQSRNFSLELTGFHAPPPEDQPVIGAYLRLSQGTILYQRIAPGERGYLDLAQFLADRWTGNPAHKRQVVATLAEVQAVWPGSPLWTAEVPSS